MTPDHEQWRTWNITCLGDDCKGLVINDREGGGGGGATKCENRGSETFCAHPPLKQGKTFRAPPPFKEWKLYTPPYNMAKTSSYRVHTTPTLFVPPFRMAKTFSAPPPPFCWGKTSRAPPLLPFCSPPLPVINDQSLTAGTPSAASSPGKKRGERGIPAVSAPSKVDVLSLYAPPC